MPEEKVVSRFSWHHRNSHHSQYQGTRGIPSKTNSCPSVVELEKSVTHGNSCVKVSEHPRGGRSMSHLWCNGFYSFLKDQHMFWYWQVGSFTHLSSGPHDGLMATNWEGLEEGLSLSYFPCSLCPRRLSYSIPEELILSRRHYSSESTWKKSGRQSHGQGYALHLNYKALRMPIVEWQSMKTWRFSFHHQDLSSVPGRPSL